MCPGIRVGNSGGTREPSSQKQFGFEEIFWWLWNIHEVKRQNVSTFFAEKCFFAGNITIFMTNLCISLVDCIATGPLSNLSYMSKLLWYVHFFGGRGKNTFTLKITVLVTLFFFWKGGQDITPLRRKRRTCFQKMNPLASEL